MKREYTDDRWVTPHGTLVSGAVPLQRLRRVAQRLERLVNSQEVAGSIPVTLIGKNKSLFVGLASFSGVGPIFIRSLITSGLFILHKE